MFGVHVSVPHFIRCFLLMCGLGFLGTSDLETWGCFPTGLVTGGVAKGVLRKRGSKRFQCFQDFVSPPHVIIHFLLMCGLGFLMASVLETWGCFPTGLMDHCLRKWIALLFHTCILAIMFLLEQ